jgi:hypothetical protein
MNDTATFTFSRLSLLDLRGLRFFLAVNYKFLFYYAFPTLFLVISLESNMHRCHTLGWQYAATYCHHGKSIEARSDNPRLIKFDWVGKSWRMKRMESPSSMSKRDARMYPEMKAVL